MLTAVLLLGCGRLEELKYLIRTQQLDHELFWRH